MRVLPGGRASRSPSRQSRANGLSRRNTKGETFDLQAHTERPPRGGFFKTDQVLLPGQTQ